ncbi:MAG: FixH family protein [Pseudomonadota bacterium]
MAMTETQPQGGKPITGWTVLFWLIGFFAVIFIVNGIFVYTALNSFPGVETDSAYKAGQVYDTEYAAAMEQNARGWDVSIDMERRGDQSLHLAATPRDTAGAPLTGIALSATLQSVRGVAHDRTVTFVESETGRYVAVAESVGAGNWTIELNAEQNGVRVYRSRNRVFLK